MHLSLPKRYTPTFSGQIGKSSRNAFSSFTPNKPQVSESASYIDKYVHHEMAWPAFRYSSLRWFTRNSLFSSRSLRFLTQIIHSFDFPTFSPRFLITSPTAFKLGSFFCFTITLHEKRIAVQAIIFLKQQELLDELKHIIYTKVALK